MTGRSPSPVTLLAPAKINLSLHVCGKRADGYHLLDSLVIFAGVGDVVSAAPAQTLSLSIIGPFSEGLGAGDDNLVVKAARYLAARGAGTNGAMLSLEKNLPVASGIGGGSSDAAATLLACAQLWGMDAATLASTELASNLGADIPVCLSRSPARMHGIGEHLDPVPALPSAGLVLVNPRKPLSTKAVFEALAGRHSGPAPAFPAAFVSVSTLAAYLKTCTNDLARPAMEVLPDIGTVVDALAETPGCLLSRMSGSGPTCFGLFENKAAAEIAAGHLSAAHPDWWIAPAPLLTGPQDSALLAR